MFAIIQILIVPVEIESLYLEVIHVRVQQPSSTVVDRLAAIYRRADAEMLSIKSADFQYATYLSFK